MLYINTIICAAAVAAAPFVFWGCQGKSPARQPTHHHRAPAKIHKVNWKIPQVVNGQEGATDLTACPGDEIHFSWNNTAYPHNVLKVSADNAKNCSGYTEVPADHPSNSNTGTYTHTVPHDPGSEYAFVCSVKADGYPPHCSYGQKLIVTVAHPASDLCSAQADPAPDF
jgi:plastocyanin